jgi:hypothetical protein
MCLQAQDIIRRTYVFLAISSSKIILSPMFVPRSTRHNPHTNPLQLPKVSCARDGISIYTMRARQTMANEIIEQVGTNTNFLKAEGRNMCFLHLLQIQNDLCGGRNLGVFLVVEVDL